MTVTIKYLPKIIGTMKLLEYKGKELLRKSGIKVPPSILTNNRSYINLSYHKEKYKNFFLENKDVVIKAQIISGKRSKNGLIDFSNDFKESLEKISQMYEREFNNKKINTLLIEKRLDIEKEYFLSIFYDTETKSPKILFSKKGGIEIEEINKEEFHSIIIDITKGVRDFECRELAINIGFTGPEIMTISNIIKKAYNCFINFDCKILEINPLVKTKEGLYFAADAKITIDDSAIARQEIFSEITDIEDESFLSKKELDARKIDYGDHRGVAGKTFLELDGDIAILASGGGGSLTAMDAIIEAGGNPANYCEYSGNPPKEKVRRLTEITLNDNNLNGCLVIGGKANFTDIYETLSGFMEEIIKIKPKYPIIIRRAGPRDKEAFDMIRRIIEEENLDITLHGEELPMSKAAHLMVDKVNKYKQENGISQ